jgi:phosphoribosylformylglycinamidine synthase subunit PurQ / glutaminase
MKPQTLILRAAGTNCDQETAYAFQLAGANTQAIHVNRLLEEASILNDYQILAIPGGFSYGDDINSGRILANQLRHHLAEPLKRFIEAGKPVIGICNGFQILVKTDLLPGPLAGRTGQTCTLTHNDSGRFIDRWVKLQPHPSKCIWTQNLQPLDLPIAHGEGKFVPANDAVRKALWNASQVALTYAGDDKACNGSVDCIAGVCDASGLVFGLMPHPERYVDPTQHPAWTRQKPLPEVGSGLAIFQNAVKYAAERVGAGV